VRGETWVEWAVCSSSDVASGLLMWQGAGAKVAASRSIPAAITQ